MNLSHFLFGPYILHHPGISPKTVECYGYSIRSLRHFVGSEVGTEDLSADLLLHFIADRLSRVSRKTAKRERADILALWREAYRQHLATEKPPDDLPRINLTRPVPTSWRLEEVTRILRVCAELQGTVGEIAKRDWWLSLILFLYDSGARISAALAVAPTDLDFQSSTVRLRGQSAKTRVEQMIPLSNQTITAIRRHFSATRQYLWPWPHRREAVFIHLGRILQRAGLPADRRHKFHCLRRTTYTLCTRYGSADIARTQLGHRTDLSAYYLDTTQLDRPTAISVLPRPAF